MVVIECRVGNIKHFPWSSYEHSNRQKQSQRKEEIRGGYD